MWWTKWRKCRSKAILDTETGELIEFRTGDRIVRKASLEAYSRLKEQNKEYQEWKIEHFYKGNIEEIRKTMQNLDVYEKAFLYSIATYIGYEDCCLKYDNGIELKFDSLVEISGISKGKLSSVISSLVEKDILYKGKNSNTMQYFVNPWLFCKGNRINKVLKTMFKNYKIQVFNGTKWKDLKE